MVMFFGMCNSPPTFQAMMDAIFVDMIEGCIVIIYMDDILIFARTEEDLERYTKLVLQRLRENDLFLKALKCEFNKTRIEYLGMIIEEGKFAMDPIKLGRNTRLAYPHHSKTSQVFPRVWQFLQTIHSPFFRIGKAIERFNKEGQEMGMD
jgi:hypothetical protein